MLFLACAVLLVLPVADFQHDRLLSRLLDFGHFPLFALIFWCVLNFLPRKPDGSRRWGAAIIATLLLNLVAECVQPMFGRSSGIADWFIGTAGCLGAALLLLPTTGKVQLLFYGVMLMLLLASLMPAGWVALDRRAARADFPLLSSFESPWELDRWEYRGCSLRRTRENATEERHALEITIDEEVVYPGLFLVDMPRDWSEMESLGFDLFWPSDTDVLLWVRVDDSVGSTYGNRVQQAQLLHRGSNRILLSRDLVSITPEGRSLNLKSIQSFGLFLEKGTPGLVFYLDNVTLNLK